jgi:hypothetical protein
MNTKKLFEKINTELKKINSITEKLEYLKIYTSNINNEEINLFYLVDKLAGEHFKELKNVEFTYWFLKYKGKKLFDSYLASPNFKMLNESNLRLSDIEAEIKQIESLEKGVIKKYSKKKTLPNSNYNPDNNLMYLFNEEHKDVELKRILNGNYYNKIATPTPYNKYGEEDGAYFRHILLKPYLLSLLDGEMNTKAENLEPEEDVNNEAVWTHPPHDPNYWNLKCYNLFKYLFEKYYKGYIRQLTNIWFFLKEHEPLKYTLKATKDDYIKFIRENYNIEIKNFTKSQTKYSDKDYPTMQDHRIIFESSLK